MKIGVHLTHYRPAGAPEPAIENGAVEIHGDRVAAVYTAQQLAERLQAGDPQLVRRDFGKAIILPGFINLHTQVEWTAQELWDTQSSVASGASSLRRVSSTSSNT